MRTQRRHIRSARSRLGFATCCESVGRTNVSYPKQRKRKRRDLRLEVFSLISHHTYWDLHYQCDENVDFYDKRSMPMVNHQFPSQSSFQKSANWHTKRHVHGALALRDRPRAPHDWCTCPPTFWWVDGEKYWILPGGRESRWK